MPFDGTHLPGHALPGRDHVASAAADLRPFFFALTGIFALVLAALAVMLELSGP